MEAKKQNLVTTNTDSITDQPTLSITLDGYPLLQYMEDLQEQHKILTERIADLYEKTSAHKTVTPAATRKKEELKILKGQREQIQSKFNFLALYVQEYAKKQYDDVDCKIIISYYCDINKVRRDLQDDINKYIECTARNFRVKLQNNWLKTLVKKV